jgi:beta-phosphoglucomutase
MESRIQAILFDLDGVLTDTAEYHYQAWQALADAEGLPFDRQANERLRGVSRRASLDLLLGDRTVDEATALAWMERKNRHYQQLLDQLTPADLLPGVAELLDEIRAAGLHMVVVSASHNAATVIERLKIAEYFTAIIAGLPAQAAPGFQRPKPAPDLFLAAAAALALEPWQCLVVEDAASGIAAGRAAGMVTVGLGPPERAGEADLTLPSLAGVSLAQLFHAATWQGAEPGLDPARQHHWETVLTIGNGYLGTRGSFEERYPDDKPATLVHGLWDAAPVVYTELANAFDWTALDLWIDGQPFRLDHGQVSAYSRFLDLRRGELHRTLRWTPPGGPLVELRFTRFASLADPHALGVRLELTPLAQTGVTGVPSRARARLDGHVENDGLLHWRRFDQGQTGDGVYLTALTRSSDKRLALAMNVQSNLPTAALAYDDCPADPGLSLAAELAQNQTVVVDKLVSIYTDRDTADPVAAALDGVAGLAQQGFPALQMANQAAWADFWRQCDVVIEGDDEAQLAVRHSLFQLRIAAPAQDERVSIGARSLSGFGYRGHVFWDTEIFVLPFFTFTQPALARNLLLYRWHTLAGARRKASAGGFTGAQFAWESAETGDEVTPRWVPGPQGEELVRIWPGDIELHISSDVAYAIWQYWQVTGDDDFMVHYGAQILLETARFWESRVEPNKPARGLYSISDVIGPDEYHDHVDNNAFTNGMVRWHLRTAAAVLTWLAQHDPPQAVVLRQALDLTEPRLAHWQEIAEGLLLRRDPQSGLIEQFDGFFNLKEVDWANYAGRTQSMQAILGIEGANQHQVIKQPDVLMLLLLLRDEYSKADLQTNWDYYSPRTDHTYGSSLGPAFHAWAACELGQPDRAYEHFMRAARADIGDVRGNARDGIHIASAGGLWQALAFGFAGLRLTASGYTVQPRLPAHWRRLAFGFTLRGQHYEVDLQQ